VKEPHGDPATRINAAQRLREIGTDEALLALLERFTISASPSRQDEMEKEEVLSWIVEFGERATPALTRFLKRDRQVYWPCRALQEILPAEDLCAKIEEVLRFHWENPPADSDPKAQIIRFAEGLHSPSLQAVIVLFLEDEDDDVRLAALDYLLHRPEEEARELVLNCYLESEDRPRIRAQLLDRLVELGWSVRGYRPRIELTLPAGFILTRDGVLKSVGRMSDGAPRWRD
jgi:HEAT repeat protein